MTDAVTHEALFAEEQGKKRGFTLTEIAIVLGIIGLILGAIWVAAGSVYQNLRISKAKTELLQIAQGVRSLYATQSTVDVAAGTDETTALIAAKVFPSDTISSSTANNVTTSTVQGPWAGSVLKVYSSTQPGGVTGDSFQVLFAGIPQSACVGLATGNTGTGRDTALVAVDIVASSASTYIAPSYTTFPITAPTAVSKCTATVDGIAFTFSLRG